MCWLFLKIWTVSAAALASKACENVDDQALLQRHQETLRNETRAGRHAAAEVINSSQHYFFFVKLEENKKHNMTLYTKALGKLCSRVLPTLRQRLPLLEEKIGIMGDLHAINSMAPECNSFLHGNQTSAMMLSYSDVVQTLAGETEEQQCSLKFGGGRLQRNVVQIWLNKLPLLCKVAEDRPDIVTTLTDVNAHYPMLHWAFSEGPKTLDDGKLGTLTYLPRNASEHYFSNKNCTSPVRVWAKYMAIRGRDCPKVMAAYNKILASKSNYPKACPCFDEEWVLSRLQRENPELVHLQGKDVGHAVKKAKAKSQKTQL
mmetsp:Transcript_49962/g.89964  ORF Transcript_49962/g.89964 Transcript_49962/m.89964 type:complete len:316 (+) Transcript_49962:171-1118(+)